jgi:hypothetical protein
VRGLFVGTVGAVVLAAAAFGLSLDAFRAGPFDRPLDPVVLTADAVGTYSSRGASEGPLGLCVDPPCAASTTVDLVLQGMPDVPYDVRLQGPGGSESIGTLRPDAGIVVVRWDQPRDHGDKDRLVLAVAGRDVATLPVRASAEPLDLAGPVAVSWGAHQDVVHVNEIGGVTMSSIATTRLDEAPPSGWEFRARFEGPSGQVDLGALEAGPDGAVLDGRAERLRLEDHERVVVLVAPSGAGADEGFPILAADLWP